MTHPQDMPESIVLPFANERTALPLTLAVAEALERASVQTTGRGMCALAAALVENTVDENTLAAMLSVCEKFAGARSSLSVTGDAARGLLAEILLAVLQPLQAAGALARDESGRKYADFKTLRAFFLGVVGWTPEALRQASLQDIAAAKDGFVRNRFPDHQPGRVTGRFMAQMMKKFPDTRNAEKPSGEKK